MDMEKKSFQPLSLPLSLTAWPYFCSLVISASPCLTTSAYCLFLSSGRLVSMIPLTRSMVHGIRSPAINLAKSLGSEKVKLAYILERSASVVGIHTCRGSQLSHQSHSPCC